MIERLGLLSEDVLQKAGSPLDTLSNHLANTLAYEAGERDMILMRHEVIECNYPYCVFIRILINLFTEHQ